jgi:1,4-dihydroxy-2-naphthoyl-CoA hydrolase
LVCCPVAVEKFSTGSAKKARYATEWPSISSSLGREGGAAAAAAAFFAARDPGAALTGAVLAGTSELYPRPLTAPGSALPRLSGVTAPDLPDWYAQLPSALDLKLGFEPLELSPERVVGRMPVQGNTQPLGLWHGGASGVLIETLGSIGANLHAGEGYVAVGVDLNATHHRTARAGWVTGTATALRLGRTVATYEVVLVDDDGERVCTGRLTCQVVPDRR